MRTILNAAIVAVAVVSAVGCVPDDGPVIIKEVNGLSGTASACALTTQGLISGSLDVSAPTTFVGGMTLISQTGVVTQPGSLTGTEVQRGDPNDAIFDTVAYDYNPKTQTTVGTEEAPIFMVVPAGGEFSLVNLPFFGSKARESLPTSGVDASGTTINVGIRFQGRLRSGGGRIDTNRIVFPITVFSSGFAGCPMGQVVAANGPCGNVGGSNGVPVFCCPAGTPNCATPAATDGGP